MRRSPIGLALALGLVLSGPVALCHLSGHVDGRVGGEVLRLVGGAPGGGEHAPSAGKLCSLCACLAGQRALVTEDRQAVSVATAERVLAGPAARAPSGGSFVVVSPRAPPAAR